MAELQALIFDVDGTLAKTERDGHRIAFNRAFAEAGLSWHWSVSLYGELLAVSGGKERLRYYLENYSPETNIPEPLEQYIARLHGNKTRHYQQLLKEGSIPLRVGVQRLMQEARKAGIRLAVATTSALPNAMALIEKHFDPEWLEVIGAGDMVANKKPAPDIYQYVLQQMQLSPQDCLALEDSQAGLQSATAAGLPTVVTANEYTQNQDFSDAKLVLNHLGDDQHPCTVLATQVDAIASIDCFDVEAARKLHATVS
jgi:HAD superfamily hydrolase (TIGR01509 family)